MIGTRFFRFPNDPDLRETWKAACQRVDEINLKTGSNSICQLRACTVQIEVRKKRPVHPFNTLRLLYFTSIQDEKKEQI